MSIYDQAVDLGREIARTEEYDRMQVAEQAVRYDSDALRVVKDFQDLQQSYYRMQMMGQQLTEDNLNSLKEVEDRAMANELVKKYYAVRMQFHEIVEKVNAKIQEGITGIYADHSCSGG